MGRPCGVGARPADRRLCGRQRADADAVMWHYPEPAPTWPGSPDRSALKDAPPPTSRGTAFIVLIVVSLCVGAFSGLVLASVYELFVSNLPGRRRSRAFQRLGIPRDSSPDKINEAYERRARDVNI